MKKNMMHLYFSGMNMFSWFIFFIRDTKSPSAYLIWYFFGRGRDTLERKIILSFVVKMMLTGFVRTLIMR